MCLCFINTHALLCISINIYALLNFNVCVFIKIPEMAVISSLNVFKIEKENRLRTAFVYICEREDHVTDAHDRVFKRVMLLCVSVQSWHMHKHTHLLKLFK